VNLDLCASLREHRRMAKKKQKRVPALARALKRCGEMEAPDAYFVLHEEWAPAIAGILDPVLWAEVPLLSETRLKQDALHER
jgi:hypothetical protein